MTSKPRKAFVLLSGGMDSTTCLHKAIVDFAPPHDGDFLINEGGEFGVTYYDEGREYQPEVDWVEAISVDYGQRHQKEMQYAAKTCEKFGIGHKILNIQGILSGKGVMLADANVQIPNIDYADIKGVSPTYVPFRNGTLLSLITAHAQKWVNDQIEDRLEANLQERDIPPHLVMERKAELTAFMKDSVGIYFGAHAEDAHNWAYPDCTPEFIGAMANAIYTGSYYAIRLITPLEWASKTDVVRLGESLNVLWEDTWSCYAGGEHHCGTCPTCRARRSAFGFARVKDPTTYAK
jgi:7-cyano-7-deazaguanine synthase